MHRKVLTAAAITTMAATTASALSSALTAGRGAGAGARDGEGRGATGAAAALEPVGVAICVGGGKDDGAPAVGPPGGKVGNLMVGAAEGFGGRLMRTVSFLGWTLEPSGGFGGTAPPGKLGMFSAINLFQANLKLGAAPVKLLFAKKCRDFLEWPRLMAALEARWRWPEGLRRQLPLRCPD